MVVLTEHQLLHAARCVVDDHQLTDRDRAFNPPAAVPHQRGAHRSWGRGVVPAVGAWWRARATACDVFQVVMVPWCFAVITALFALGGGWAAREETGRGSQAIKLCSDRSFGVFLMHPVLLLVWILGPAGWLSSRMPALWSTMLAFTAVVSASLLVVELSGVARSAWC